jgi:flagellar biosynthesis protein FlhF
MKIRKYRAATMRAALEQIKNELGEEALVIDTKRVRVGGVLGLGARELIEVRATANPSGEAIDRKNVRQNRIETSEKESSRTVEAARRAHHETSEARPKRSGGGRVLGATFKALAMRAYQDAQNASVSKSTQPFAAAQKFETANQTAPPSTVGVEISEDAPRIVRATKPKANAIESGETLNSAKPPAKRAASRLTPTQPSKSEARNSIESRQTEQVTPSSPLDEEIKRKLKHLNSEIREVKFALNAFVRNRAMIDFMREPPASALSEKDAQIFDSPYYETYLVLAARLSPELARRAVRAAIAHGCDEMFALNDDAQKLLERALAFLISFTDDPLTAPQTTNEPRIFALVGATGVGKTTTLAKMAARLALRERRRVALITFDTYRIAAVEQLKTYAELIGAQCRVARSVLDLNYHVRRLADDAVVLIDTIGCSPADLSSQLELADYLRASEEITKCLVVQATTHYTDAMLAAQKYELYGASRLILTKLDETAYPANAVQIAADTAAPLIYFCAGQRVPEDLTLAAPDSLAAQLSARSNSFVRAA